MARRPQVAATTARSRPRCPTVRRVDEIPSWLLAGAHTAAVLGGAGCGRSDLASPLWHQALPGRWAWTATDPRHPRQRALVAASALPADGALGGWAAAFLLGADDLDGSTADPDRFDPVLLCLQRPRQRRWWPGVRPFRSDLGPGDVVERDGVAVTSALRTAFDLGRLAPSLTEAVVALDVVVRDLAVDPVRVASYAWHRPGWRGLPQLRQALGLVDPRTRSPQESRTRMLWVLDAGLPAPKVNWPVLDLDSRLLGEVDLLDADAGLVVEYDGADHADSDQRGTDAARHEALDRHGLEVVRLVASDLTTQRRRTLLRLRRAHSAGLARDRSRDRWFAPTSAPPPRV